MRFEPNIAQSALVLSILFGVDLKNPSIHSRALSLLIHFVQAWAQMVSEEWRVEYNTERTHLAGLFDAGGVRAASATGGGGGDTLCGL